MTPSTHSPTRQINHASAIADAEDDFITDVNAFGVTDYKKVNRDLVELEALANLTAEYVKRADFILGRLTYARGTTRYPLMAYQLDVIDDQIDHGGGNVVRAHVKKMEIEK